MNYLNLGCGTHFSHSKEWTNIDFYKTGEGVIAHNLLQGIPFKDNTFDVVYHSHMLEHFSKQDAEKLLLECKRVLKQNGILRIAVPDLEQIVNAYLKAMQEGLENISDINKQANYDWMIIELFDQMIRNVSGGMMLSFLEKKEIVNEEFVYERIGFEGKQIREYLLHRKPQNILIKKSFFQKIKLNIKNILCKNYQADIANKEIGKFRVSGEIHQWMYDRYSLQILLKKLGFEDFKVVSAFASNIPDWETYKLDSINNQVRKPDSLFIEARKYE